MTSNIRLPDWLVMVIVVALVMAGIAIGWFYPIVFTSVSPPVVSCELSKLCQLCEQVQSDPWSVQENIAR